jgi:hypothetical protein
MTLLNGEKLHFELRPSRYWMGLLLLLHLGALVIVLILPLQWWAVLAISLILTISLIYHIEKSVRYRFKTSIKVIETQDGKNWRLFQCNQQFIDTTIMKDSIVTSYLLILNFQTKFKTRHNVVLFKDAIDRTDFNKLRHILLNQIKR